MEVIDDFGLPVALVVPDELPMEPWKELDQPVAVVRMPDPPLALRPELTRRGFVCKPSTLTWVARLGKGEEAFLRAVPRKSRQYLHRARRHIGETGLREVVEDRVSADSFDKFLTLYEAQVERMRYGIAFARRNRDAVLHGPQKYFGVFLFERETLVGGCVVLEAPDKRAVRVRFSAVTDRERAASVPRALYFSALRTARDKGYRWATLGDDPNLYGHIARPGLFTFKSRMGFEAVPSQDFADPHGCDEADLVLSLDQLSDPSLILEYSRGADGGAGHALQSCLISRSRVDVRHFTAGFLTGTVVQPPGGRG